MNLEQLLRYVSLIEGLCYNPVREQDNQFTRQRLIELTKARLSEIANYKRSTTVEVLGSRVGKALQKYKVRRLKPLLDNDGKHAKRQWSLQSIIETLKSLAVNTVKQSGTEYQILASPTQSQLKILNLLGIKNIVTALKW